MDREAVHPKRVGWAARAEHFSSFDVINTGRIVVKILGTTTLALFAATTIAYAAADPFADLYSNTLVYTSPDNVVTKVLVEKDGTWTSTASNGKADKGAWAALGNFVCVSDAAMPKTKPDCSKIVTHKVGDKWTEPGAKKGTVDQITLTAGR